MIHRLSLFLYDIALLLIPGLGVRRSRVDQTIVDIQAQTMLLYATPSTQNSVKVIKEIKRLGLKIPIVNPLLNNTYWEDLIVFGGKKEIPCLKIKRRDKRAKYLYFSDDIIGFLQREFSGATSHDISQ